MADCNGCDDDTALAGVSIGGEIVPTTNVPGVGEVAEIACPDEGGPVTEPVFPDTPDCACAVRRLCPFDVDGELIEWWTLCEQDGRCKWQPDIAVLIENANSDQTEKICAWLVENCEDDLASALTQNTTFIDNVITQVVESPLFCQKVAKITDFDSEAGSPTCTTGSGSVCVELFRDTSLISDDCPGGVVTHGCVNGTVVCLGAGGEGGDPAGGTEFGTWRYGLGFVSNSTPQCSYPLIGSSAGNLPAALIADIQGSAGVCVADIPVGSSFRAIAATVVHTGGNLILKYQARAESDGIAPANPRGFIVTIMQTPSGTNITPASHTSSNPSMATSVTSDPAQCGSYVGNSAAPPNASTNIMIDYGPQPAGTYSLVMKSAAIGDQSCIAELKVGP